MAASPRTRKRRKVGRQKAEARESNRERAGAGTAWWMRPSRRRAAWAFLWAARRRRLRSSWRGLLWRLLWDEGAQRRRPVVIVDMGASLVAAKAFSYLHCTKKAPPLPTPPKWAEVDLSNYPRTDVKREPGLASHRPRPGGGGGDTRAGHRRTG